MTRNNVNIDEVLDVPVSYPNSVFTGLTTYSTLFLPPIFKVYLSDNIYGRFVNCYIEDLEMIHSFKRPLFLLVKTSFDATYRDIHHSLTTNKTFVYDYIAGRSGEEFLIMYVFNCPKEFEEDYDRVLSGRYSKTSDKYKALFQENIQKVDGTYGESAIYGILHKTRLAKKKVEGFLSETSKVDSPVRLSKDQEYFGTFNDVYEIFRY